MWFGKTKYIYDVIHTQDVIFLELSDREDEFPNVQEEVSLRGNNYTVRK